MSRPIDDPDAPPSAEEIAEAEKLRDALADPRIANEAATFARAAALAHAPREIAGAEHRAIVEAALEKMPAQKPAKKPRVIRVAFGVAAALSMAAAALLVVKTRSDAVYGERAEGAGPAWAEPLAPARSTQPLFHEPFAGSGSARIDRIARARAEDLRDNRFAMRGVR